MISIYRKLKKSIKNDEWEHKPYTSMYVRKNDGFKIELDASGYLHGNDSFYLRSKMLSKIIMRYISKRVSIIAAKKWLG